MKKILRWSKKILGYGFVGLVFFILLDLAMWYFPPNRGWEPWAWESSGPVAVGNNYSIELLTRTAHLFLAEYDQKIIVYGGTERQGEKKGAIKLHMNTGGRTHIMIYSAAKSDHQIVILLDRFGMHEINITEMNVETFSKTASVDNMVFIGTWSGESYPLKFIPPCVWPENTSGNKLSG